MFKKILFASFCLLPFIAQAQETISTQELAKTIQTQGIQNAGNASPAERTMNQIVAISGAIDYLSISSGSYQGKAETAKVAGVLGAPSMKSITGGDIIISNATSKSYQVSIPLTAPVCEEVKTQAAASKHFTSSTCDTNGVLTYTYTNG